MLTLSDPKNATTESRSWCNYFKVFLAVSVTALGYYAGKSLGILPLQWLGNPENDGAESTALSTDLRIENAFLTASSGMDDRRALAASMAAFREEMEEMLETLAVFKEKSLTVDDSEEFQVNIHTIEKQHEPAIAGLSDGGFVIAWTSSDGQDGSSNGVFAQRFTANGTKTREEDSQVNDFTDNTQSNPAVAGLNDGGFVVAWYSFSTENPAQDGSRGGIYAKCFDAQGIETQSEFKVNSHIDDDQRYPAIARLNDGGFVISWKTSPNEADTQFGVYFQQYNSTCNVMGEEIYLPSSNVQGTAPAIAGLADGGFLLAWEDNRLDGNKEDIYAKKYKADGSNDTDVFLVNIDEMTNVQRWPAIVVTADGGFVITWESNHQGNGFDIYGQRYSHNATRIDDEFPVNNCTSSDQEHIAIATLPSDGFIVIWRNTGTCNDQGILGQCFDVDGNKLGNELVITSVDTIFPKVTSLVDGSLVFTWSEKHSISSRDGSSFGVFAKIYNLTEIASDTATVSPSPSPSQSPNQANISQAVNISPSISPSVTASHATESSGDTDNLMFGLFVLLLLPCVYMRCKKNKRGSVVKPSNGSRLRSNTVAEEGMDNEQPRRSITEESNNQINLQDRNSGRMNQEKNPLMHAQTINITGNAYFSQNQVFSPNSSGSHLSFEQAVNKHLTDEASDIESTQNTEGVVLSNVESTSSSATSAW